ncbi:MAG: hypothetical protein ABTQ28_11175 [Thauera sp.]|jgi:hypothetical protein
MAMLIAWQTINAARYPMIIQTLACVAGTTRIAFTADQTFAINHLGDEVMKVFRAV